MFAKLKGNPPGMAIGPSIAYPFENPICDYFEVGKQIGSAGPELAWKVYEAVRRSDEKEASVFFFDKKWTEKFGKSSGKRKETITEVLKRGAIQVDRYRHPKILQIYHKLEETADTLAFAAEPIIGSMANVLGYLEDRLRQGVPSSLREYTFLEFEIKYGLLQITEALLYLHYACKTIHRNICPQSVIISKRGTWKLAGLEFTEKCSDGGDFMTPVSCQPFTSKLPKMCQPDLDFMAPEIQASGACSPQSDMFSFGLLICSIYNNGRSPIQSCLSAPQYTKQLESLSRNVGELLERMPEDLAEHVPALLEPAPRKRPSSQTFSMINYFLDSGVHALQYMDTLHLKDVTHKANFYHSLPSVLPLIPKKMWFQHILPIISSELNSSEVVGAALQPLLALIEESTTDEYQNLILPLIKNIYQVPKSVQATVTLFENISILLRKTPENEIRNEIMPGLISGLDSSTPQIQCASLSAISEVVEHLDEETIRKIIIPKARRVLEMNDSVQAQTNILSCVEKVIDNLEKGEILDDVLPMLFKAKLVEPVVLMPVVRIYKQMLGDKRYGLTVNLLATKAMPTLIPVVVSPNLKLDEFTLLVELLQDMLNHVLVSQRNKLKLERLSMSSTEKIHQLHRNLDQPIGYPHRPPCLTLESRRTSISVGDVVRRTSGSGASSPDSNFLRVQANLPGRRHSDNTIQPPRIFGVSPPNGPSSGPGSRRSSYGNLRFRRHSCANPNDPRYNNSIFSAMGFKQSFQAPSTEFIIPGTTSNRTSPSNRRHTAANIFHQTQNASSQLLQTLGSGIQQLFGE